MNINEFIIEKDTIKTILENKKGLKESLALGEMTKEDYKEQIDRFNKLDDNLMCALATRNDTDNHKFLVNYGLIIYNGITGEVVKFFGYGNVKNN